MSYERSNELGGGDQPFAGEFVPRDTKWRLISAVVLEEFPFVTLHTPYLYCAISQAEKLPFLRMKFEKPLILALGALKSCLSTILQVELLGHHGDTRNSSLWRTKCAVL
jgi:hypothetical protein